MENPCKPSGSLPLTVLRRLFLCHSYFILVCVDVVICIVYYIVCLLKQRIDYLGLVRTDCFGIFGFCSRWFLLPLGA